VYQPLIRRRALRDISARSIRQTPLSQTSSAPAASTPETCPMRVATPGRVRAISLARLPGSAAAAASAIEPVPV